MAALMCTQKLWRTLGERGPAIRSDMPDLHGTLLGSWTLKLFHRERRGLILALNERTYLTLVFPLAPRVRFRDHFASALAWALEDFGVPPAQATQEAAAIDYLPLLAPLGNRSIIGSLNDLEFLCQIELSYTSDLRTVQRRLNEVPHARRDPCTGMNAVARLFGGTSPTDAIRVH